MKPRLLAISSSGGHWTELLRLTPAFEGHDVTWVTTNPSYASSAPPGRFLSIRDVSMSNKYLLPVVAAEIAKILIDVWPHVIVTTGAAPGYLAIRLGNLIGARTAWVDSIANADELSLSGRRIGGHADLWLTQWEHLARGRGPHYRGSVL